MFDALAVEIGKVREIDPACLNATALNDALVELKGLQTKLDAAVTEVVAAWSERKCWEVDHAKSAAAWLAWKTHQPKRETGRQVRMADALRHMPLVAAAFAAGEINSAHVDMLRRVRTPVTEEQFERDENKLVEDAKTKHFSLFAQTVKYWHQMADEDGAGKAAAKRDARQHFDLSQSIDSLWFGSMLLNPIAGTIVNDALNSIEQDLYQQEKKAGEIVLTRSQRRAAALVEMAVRARPVRPDQVSRAPLFTVLIDYETVHGRLCELANGTVVTPGQLLPYLDKAYVERIVFNRSTRKIDEVGDRRRLFTGATRRAVQIRDQRCYHPTCDEPLDGCEIDHIIPWSNNGATSPANGQTACPFHNRDKSNTDSDPPLE